MLGSSHQLHRNPCLQGNELVVDLLEYVKNGAYLNPQSTDILQVGKAAYLQSAKRERLCKQ